MNYIITEEELISLEKTGNPSYRKSVEYVIGRIRSRPVELRQAMPDELLTELANELSTYDDGVQYCDICDHCINPDKFDLRDHTKECLLHRIATSLTAQAEGGEPCFYCTSDKSDRLLKAGNVCCPECKRELKPAPIEGWEKKECFLIFEDHEPVKLVDSMQKFNKHDSHGKTKTWLSFDLE